jgi:hypothetical protein
MGMRSTGWDERASRVEDEGLTRRELHVVMMLSQVISRRPGALRQAIFSAMQIYMHVLVDIVRGVGEELTGVGGGVVSSCRFGYGEYSRFRTQREQFPHLSCTTVVS